MSKRSDAREKAAAVKRMNECEVVTIINPQWKTAQYRVGFSVAKRSLKYINIGLPPKTPTASAPNVDR